MVRKIARKAVYGVTIVAILAMCAGFAMAAVFSNISTNTNQNGFTVTNAGNTIYGVAGSTQTSSLVFVTPGACNSITTPSANQKIASFYVDGQIACATAPNWYEEVTFVSGTAVGAATDTFTVSVSTNVNAIQVVFSGISPTADVTVNVYYALGTGASTTAGDIGVSGT